MLCEKCGKEIPKTAVFCPNCGTKVSEKRKSKKKWLIPLCIALGVAIVGGGVFATTKVGGKTSMKKSDNKVVATQKGKTGKKEYQRFREVDGKIEVYLLSEAKEYEFVYEEEDKEPLEKELVYRETCRFNEKGLRVESIREDENTIEDGEEPTRFQYTYTDKNKLESVKFESGIYTNDYNVKTKTYFYDENDKLEAVTEDDGNCTITSHYDGEHGHKILVEELHYTEGWSGKERISYEYNDAGYVTKRVSDIGEAIYYTYNDMNQITSIEEVDEKNNIKRKKVYEYDKKGRLIKSNKETFKYDKKGRLNKSNEETFKYDKKGRLSLIEKKNEYSEIKWSFKYNKQGLVQEDVRSHCNDSGKREERRKIFYDDYKNPVKISTYDELGREIFRTEMEYEAYYIDKADWELCNSYILNDKSMHSLEEDYFWDAYIVNQFYQGKIMTNSTGELTSLFYLFNEGRLEEALMLLYKYGI